jgi:hypothetical protein
VEDNMTKKDIIAKVDSIIKQENLDDVMFHLNDLKQDLNSIRELGYFYGRVRYHFDSTPEQFKEQEEMLKWFDRDNFYDEIVKRDAQRTPRDGKKI